MGAMLSYITSSLLMKLKNLNVFGQFQVRLSDAIQRSWYQYPSWALLLLPLSWPFRLIACLRRYYFSHLKVSSVLGIPVIVVGNISVGGTGKTPLLATLINELKANGFRPGVISRGYGGASKVYPLMVQPESSPTTTGDEPLLLAMLCPVVVDPNRYRAAQYLVAETDCNVILSDDGLQHYRLPRDIEIVVVDGQRGFGNGQCLPAGPLREPVSRLKEVDFILTNSANVVLDSTNVVSGLEKFSKISYWMTIEPHALRHLNSGFKINLHLADELKAGSRQSCLSEWTMGNKVYAVAGIGNPQRFVHSLESLGFEVQLQAWPDHHYFSGAEFTFDNDWPVIITAKDAVKCNNIDNDRLWVLDVVAKTDTLFTDTVIDRLSEIKRH